jgi:hypothetical protein
MCSVTDGSAANAGNCECCASDCTRALTAMTNRLVLLVSRKKM